MGGLVRDQSGLNTCECGGTPELIWHHIKGVANRINHFVKCCACKKRTRDRGKIEDAKIEWNELNRGETK